MLSAASENAVVPEMRLSGQAALLLHELLHAMGQPLTSLQLYRLLEVEDADKRETRGEIAGQIELLTEMYQALRFLLEAGEEETEVTELAPMVHRLERGWCRFAARRGITLRLEFDGTAGRILGGAGVAQALDHIVEKALESARQAVSVWIGTAEIVIDGASPRASEAQTWMLRAARVLIERAGGAVIYGGQPTSVHVRFAHG